MWAQMVTPERAPPSGLNYSFMDGDCMIAVLKVAFIKPPVGGILGLEMLTFVEPLGPICVAACLEQEGHECKVIDLRIDGEEDGMDLCRRFAPDVVGLQCNFTTERNRTVRLAERIKREMPDAFVV